MALTGRLNPFHILNDPSFDPSGLSLIILSADVHWYKENFLPPTTILPSD